jgi:hypothetical protein
MRASVILLVISGTLGVPCGPGRFSKGGFAPSFSICSECAPGYYQPMDAQESCAPCGTNTYSDAKRVSCLPCIHSWSGTAAQKCTPDTQSPTLAPTAIKAAFTFVDCAAGKFRRKTLHNLVLPEGADVQSAYCHDCPPGFWSTSGTVYGCKPCEPGYFGQGGSVSFGCSGACPPGKWSGRHAGECSDCQAGRFGTGGSTTLKCSGACLAGRYGAGGSYDNQCDGPCLAGRFGQGGDYAALCMGACRAGNFGTHEAATSADCDGPCPAGMTAKAGSTSCHTAATLTPTAAPTDQPTARPSATPSFSPTTLPTTAPSTAPTATPTTLDSCPAGMYIGVGTKEVKEAAAAVTETRAFAIERAKLKAAKLQVAATKDALAFELSHQVSASITGTAEAYIHVPTTRPTSSPTEVPSYAPTAAPSFAKATLSAKSLLSYLTASNNAATSTVEKASVRHVAKVWSATERKQAAEKLEKRKAEEEKTQARKQSEKEPLRFEEGTPHPQMMHHLQTAEPAVMAARLQTSMQDKKGGHPQMVAHPLSQSSGAEPKDKGALQMKSRPAGMSLFHYNALNTRLKAARAHTQMTRHAEGEEANMGVDYGRGGAIKAIPHSMMPAINPRLAGRRLINLNSASAAAATVKAGKQPSGRVVHGKEPAWMHGMEQHAHWRSEIRSNKAPAAVHDEIVRHKVCLTCPAGYYSLPRPPSGTTSTPHDSTHRRLMGGALAAAVGEEQIRCEPCAPGRFSSTPGAPSAIFCLPCLPGHYGDQEGMTASKCSGRCRAGRYGATTATNSASAPIMDSTVSEVAAAAEMAAAAAVGSSSSPPDAPQHRGGKRRRLHAAGLLGLANLVRKEGGSEVKRAEARAAARYTKEQQKERHKERERARRDELQARYKTAPAGPECTGPCPAGRFGSVPGAYTSDCEARCPSGYFSAEGWVSCKRCTAGQYSPTFGQTACIACEAGKYMPTEHLGVGASALALSNAGLTFAASGAGLARAMQGHAEAREREIAGLYTSSVNECTACPRGYSTGGSLGQTACGSQPTFAPTVGPTWPIGLPRVEGGVIEAPEAIVAGAATVTPPPSTATPPPSGGTAAGVDAKPTTAPTTVPPTIPPSTSLPTSSPSALPSAVPSLSPTSTPTSTPMPTMNPTLSPSSVPTIAPTAVADCPPGEEPLLTRYFQGRLKGGFREYDQLRKQQRHRSDQCAVCEAGLFSDGSGKLASKKNPLDDTESCRKCKPGRFGLGGSTAADCDGVCPAGRYGLGGDESSLCASGKSCRAGRYGNAGSSDPDCGGKKVFLSVRD